MVIQKSYQQEFKTQGQLISSLMKNSQRISLLITQKLVDNDKQFYSVLFTIVKSSQKWKQYKADVLVISVIPSLISLNILNGEEIVSVLLLAVYNEYLEFINQQNETHLSLDSLPVMKNKYENSFHNAKKRKQYQIITEITQTNLLEIHQMLLELFLIYLNQMDQVILKQAIRLGYIFCGSSYTNQELKTLEYHGVQDQIFKVQMSDRSMELLLFIVSSINIKDESILHVHHLINLIRKKAANESRFSVAGLAQSVKTITDDVFEGVF
ncbi:unnamed protein product [Paramecium primaurelia]|uniref:Uncharacterized protein n=1 Tax=Paramecium primaurelia TaxID=5886 RepID=A0A8S1JNG4_PARPR|nr:unnamed protein product [Paramecium primaurelia]